MFSGKGVGAGGGGEAGCKYKIAVNYFRLTNSFRIFKNNKRINIISNDAHFDGKFIENKHSAEFKFEIA